MNYENEKEEGIQQKIDLSIFLSFFFLFSHFGVIRLSKLLKLVAFMLLECSINACLLLNVLFALLCGALCKLNISH